ncbi:MAG: arylesterase [Saprospiraceae bacterium]
MMFRIQNTQTFYVLLMTGSLYFSISFFSSCKGKQESAPQVEETDELSDQSTDGDFQKPTTADVSYILFFGNSLTAGYGLDENQSFPALIQQRLDSLHLPYKIINAGLSGETTSGGKNRIDWVLKQKVDIFVLELGANDVLRGLDLKETEANLRAIIDKVKAANPAVKIILAGMEAPPNMGNDYTKRFAAIYPKLAKEYKAELIPFLLKDVGGIPALNLSDGKHPNEDGQYIVRENVWKVLHKVLE